MELGRGTGGRAKTNTRPVTAASSFKVQISEKDPEKWTFSLLSVLALLVSAACHKTLLYETRLPGAVQCALPMAPELVRNCISGFSTPERGKKMSLGCVYSECTASVQ